MSEPRLRPAVLADRPALLDLWEKAWSAARPDIDFAARRAWLANRLDELEAAGTLVVVARDPEESLAGFITVDPVTGHLDQLAVRVARQGRGWAKVLLDHGKRLSPSGLDLSVNQSNHRAIRLYEREGFVIREAGVNETSGHPIWHMHWMGRRLSEG